MINDSVRFSLDYLPKINYAVYMNSSALIRRLQIENNEDKDIFNAVLSVTFSPDAFEPITITIPKLPAGKTVDVGELQTKPSADILLSAAALTRVDLILHLSAGETECLSTYPLEIAPFEFWPGSQENPELLAAFVTPEDPLVEQMRLRSAQIYAQMTDGQALGGYEGEDPNGVLRQLSAVYAALGEGAIQYKEPFPDFLRDGKRIRLAGEIREKGIADSLDLSLLAAAVLEAAGLNPLVILTEDHCVPGVWLTREVYPETISYDSASVSKRTARGMNRMAVFDVAGLCTGSRSDFNRALECGRGFLEQPDRFLLSLDIRRARLLGILPVPQRVLEDGRYVLLGQDEDYSGPVLPQELELMEENRDGAQDTPLRAKNWERRLLDLSMRNSLINFRPEKSGIPLAVHDLKEFTSDLLGETDFQILHKPDDWKQAAGSESRENRREVSSYRHLALEEYQSGRIRSLIGEGDLEERGIRLVKAARSSLEETGASSLYLGLGLLIWYSRQEPEIPRYAPLILIPVEAEARGPHAGLTLRAREEEGHFNVTLTEMLKNEFGITIRGLDALPLDGDAIDVIRIFTLVRNAILQEKKWDVLEEAHLGLFSFSRFILWNDLTQNLEEFRKNKVVESLIKGQLAFPFEPIEKSSRFIEDEPGANELIFPVSADASQSLAVLAAAAGKSFVLHGPPGTGKSQTITNIIANALRQDKRVLFVAQKMAALEVVEKRLKEIGLGSFCLEIHSSKARKKAVLDQLEYAVKIQRIPKETSFETQKAQVCARKTELNKVVRQLYAMDGSGFSVYDLICENSKLKDFPKYLDLEPGFDLSRLKEQEEALLRLARMGVHAGGPYGHPLKGIGCVEFGPMLKEEIARAAELDLSGLRAAQEALVSPGHVLEPGSLAEADWLLSALTAFSCLAGYGLSADEDLSKLLDTLRSLAPDLVQKEAAQEEILKSFGLEFLNADPQRLLKDFNLFEQKNVLERLWRKNPVEKEMMLFSKSGVMKKQEIPDHLARLDELQTTIEQIKRKLAGLPALLKREEELTAVEIQGFIADLERALEAAGEEEAVPYLAQLCAEEGFEQKLRRFALEMNKQSGKIHHFFDLSKFEEDSLRTYDGSYFSRLSRKLEDITGSLDQLRDWLIYCQARLQAVELGLEQFVKWYNEGHVSDQELLPAFKKSVIQSELVRRLQLEPGLLNCTGRQLDEKAAELKERAAQLELLEQRELYYHLAKRIPSLVLDSDTSREISILQRALRSGARNLSIRSLFAETDGLLRQIAPCMLMSPMSVAQYLKPEADLFDLVVFDEASQIPTPEAIGALGRAKEAIIVGDPKQLPPTSFFMTQNTGADEPEEGQDLDNILEDCLALSMPESYLLWHYRSRHESLIAFSNRNFYDSRLYTYPSPDDLVSKVTLKQVGGVYERGRERVNRKEAEEIVLEVVRRLKDPAKAGQTIGIVTFSVVQQNLIEKLLKEKIEGDEQLENALLNMHEPIFIKNLENVQGDERDVILFSVGYGPDQDGRMTMNFGPLNQEGGWRRLNVAVSRARLEMVIFTNIDLTQFIVSGSQPRGVRDLRAFLDFARKGNRTLSLAEIRHEEQFGNLNSQIADKLRERGWRVETGIGTSRFKVDLGLVDPRDPGRFLLGVLCGGESYRSSEAAYDREVLQPAVLKGLEWKIQRVFAMDWLENEDKVTDQIIKKAEQLLIKGTRTDSTAEEEFSETRQRPYGKTALPVRRMMMDEIFKESNASRIREDLTAIIEAEGPISCSLLARRAKSLYELSRVTSRLEKQVEQLISPVHPVTQTSAGVLIYWPQGSQPERFDVFRPTPSEDIDRQLRDIAPEEVLAAVKEIAQDKVSERQLIRETASVLGYPSLNIDTEHLLRSILTDAVLAGILEKNGPGVYRLKDQV